MFGPTAAHIPMWVKYDPSDPYIANRFGSENGPELVEQFFQHRLGRANIAENYVTGLENSLGQINEFIQAIGSGRKSSHPCIVLNDLVYTVMYGCNDELYPDYRQPFILFDDILVRPCGEKLGLFRIFLWQIIQSCLEWGCDLRIEKMSSKVKTILEKMHLLKAENSPFRRIKSRSYDRKDYWLLHQRDMRQISMEQVGIGPLLLHTISTYYRIHLDREILPESRELNSEYGLNSRPTRSIHNIRRQSATPIYYMPKDENYDKDARELSSLFHNKLLVSKRPAPSTFDLYDYYGDNDEDSQFKTYKKRPI